MLSKQNNKEKKKIIYSLQNDSQKNTTILKSTSEKFQNFNNLTLFNSNTNNLNINKGSNRNLNYKIYSDKKIRKKKSLNEYNNNNILSYFNSKSNKSNHKKRKSIDEFFSPKYTNEKINSSSFIVTSGAESSKSKKSKKSSKSNKSSKSSDSSNSSYKIPNSNSNSKASSNKEEEKKGSNEENDESKEKMSYNNNIITENNNENSNFSRIEEESSENSSELESNNNNFKWSKKFKNSIFDRFKKMVKIVKLKKKNDYNSIILAIKNNEDDKILEVLTGKEFKKFYRNKDNLFEKDVFMDEMIKNKKFDLLKKISQDPFYEFDKNYIFDCFFYCIAPIINEDKKHNLKKNNKQIICYSFDYEFFDNTLNMDKSFDSFLKTKPKKYFKYINDDTILEIITGLVENNLYDYLNYKKIEIIFWFMTLLGFNYSLYDIIKNNEKIILHSLKKEENENKNVISLSKIFNDIKSNKELDMKEINSYTINYYLKTIEDCLSCNLEDLAILLANLRKPYPELLTTYKMAMKHENMMYLKFIWEKSINYNKKILEE